MNAAAVQVSPDPRTEGAPIAPESAWQQRLLPFMASALGLLTIFFCASLTYETISVQRHIESAHEIDLAPLITRLEGASAANATAALAEFRLKALALLEGNVIERRYHQASAGAIGRIYLIFLGFATGMVLALAGATFILGKLKEGETFIDGGGPSIKATLRSGSPGVILACFGTALMLSTIFSRVDIAVRDQALYIAPAGEIGEFVTGRTTEAEQAPPARKAADILRQEVKPLLNTESAKKGGAK